MIRRRTWLCYSGRRIGSAIDLPPRILVSATHIEIAPIGAALSQLKTLLSILVRRYSTS
jgi:hypothetical protein